MKIWKLQYVYLCFLFHRATSDQLEWNCVFKSTNHYYKASSLEKIRSTKETFYNCELSGIDYSDASEVSINLSEFANPENLRTMVEIENSDIRNIPSQLFTSFPDLDYFRMDGAKNFDIKSDFESASLTKIWISNGNFETLDEKIFPDVPNLEHLSIIMSGIKSLHQPAFEGLSKLKGLYLNDNEIKTMDRKLFTDLHNLEEFDLSNNKIKVLDILLNSNFKLKNFGFAKNSMSAVNPIIFDNNLDLEYATFSSNLCVDMEFGNFANQSNISRMKKELFQCFSNFTSFLMEIIFDNSDKIGNFDKNMFQISADLRDNIELVKKSLLNNNVSIYEEIKNLENLVADTNEKLVKDLTDLKSESEIELNEIAQNLTQVETRASKETSDLRIKLKEFLQDQLSEHRGNFTAETEEIRKDLLSFKIGIKLLEENFTSSSQNLSEGISVINQDLKTLKEELETLKEDSRNEELSEKLENFKLELSEQIENSSIKIEELEGNFSDLEAKIPMVPENLTGELMGLKQNYFLMNESCSKLSIEVQQKFEVMSQSLEEHKANLTNISSNFKTKIQHLESEIKNIVTESAKQSQYDDLNKSLLELRKKVDEIFVEIITENPSENRSLLQLREDPMEIRDGHEEHAETVDWHPVVNDMSLIDKIQFLMIIILTLSWFILMIMICCVNRKASKTEMAIEENIRINDYQVSRF